MPGEKPPRHRGSLLDCTSAMPGLKWGIQLCTSHYELGAVHLPSAEVKMQHVTGSAWAEATEICCIHRARGTYILARAFRLFAKQTPKKPAARIKARVQAQEGEPAQVSLEIIPVCSHHAVSVRWACLCGHGCHPAVYLSRHLPDTVDELQEDGRAIRIRVVLVPMADSLQQQDKEHQSHRASWGNCFMGSALSHLNLSQQL